MSSLSYDEVHNYVKEQRLKRLNERRLKLPWDRDVEDSPDNSESESLESGESDIHG